MQAWWERIRALVAFLSGRLLFGVGVLLAVVLLTHLSMLVLQGMNFGLALQQAWSDSLAYLSRILQGDLGISSPGSVAYMRVPVAALLPELMIRSLGLLGAAFLLAVAIGVPLGAWAAVRRRSKSAVLILLASLVGVSTPSFFAALFLQIAAIQYTRYFGKALVSVGGFGWDSHIVLPMLVLAARPVAQIARVTYVSLAGIFDSDYVRTANSKGMRQERVFWVHMLRNAAIPIVTTIAVSLRFSLSTLPVVELYFGWGGIGQGLRNSIFNLDTSLTTAIFLVLGVLFLGINLLQDIAYLLIDPRLRESSKPGALRRDTYSLGRLAASAWIETRAFFTENPLVVWVGERVKRLRRRPSGPSPFLSLLKDIPAEDLEEAAGTGSHWRAWQRGLFGNLPLLLGGLIVTALIVATLFGPRLAPYNPNTTQIVAMVDGVIATPPFPPGELHPWGTDPLGRDLYSLILAGAQQTVILAFAVMAVRLVVGFTLGALAGWFQDSWLDRLLVGLTQALAVFPALLLSALLIFVVGIQHGMGAFIVALSLVGWGEVMQFVRGEVIAIRPKPFIESAVAIGQRSSRLILMHVLPNLTPALVSLAALEMGAVLLLLGELGFLGIYMRGGTGSELGMYSQVPEWGALLSWVRSYTRSYPWTGFFPTAAFFAAVLGFNLLGEGVRRLFTEVGVVMKSFINRYTLAVAALILAAFFWQRGNSGELVFWRQSAERFDGAQAMAHLKDLTAPEMEGRALDSTGMQAAAEEIRHDFRRLGLQPAGEDMEYFQIVERSYLALERPPVLAFDDDSLDPVYRTDFSIYPGQAIGQGQVQGQVRLLAFGSQASVEGLDLSEQVVLLLSEKDLPRLQPAVCQGVLVMARDLNDIKQRLTLPAGSPGKGCGQETPVFWISERLAIRLMGKGGGSAGSLQDQAAALKPDEVLDAPLKIRANLEVEGWSTRLEVANVLGQLPGVSEALDDRLIVVAAQYDGPVIENGEIYPGANENASGVAVMLEAIRTLQAEYQPSKTFLFVAYSGEGLPNGMDAPPVESFLSARPGFSEAYEVEAVIYLRGLGSGQEDTLAVWSPRISSLAKLMETAASLSGMETQRLDGPASMNMFYPPNSMDERETAPESVPSIGVSRLGWERSARLSNDTVTFLPTENLRQAGEAVTLALMILGRETNY